MAFIKTSTENINKCVRCGSLAVELIEEEVHCYDCAKAYEKADISLESIEKTEK